MTKTVEEYLKSYSHCPHCNSPHIEAQAMAETDDGHAYQDIWCKDCHAQWTDSYTLTGYKMDYTPPLQLQVRWIVSEDGDIRPATAKEVSGKTEHEPFIGLYQQNPATKLWEWMSDYASLDELADNTGITSVPYPME